MSVILVIQHNNNIKSKLEEPFNNSDDEGELGQADVTAEEDCVVFSWDFLELDELLTLQTSLGVVFELCISADVNSKMVSMMELGSQGIGHTN